MNVTLTLVLWLRPLPSDPRCCRIAEVWPSNQTARSFLAHADCFCAVQRVCCCLSRWGRPGREVGLRWEDSYCLTEKNH